MGWLSVECMIRRCYCYTSWSGLVWTMKFAIYSFFLLHCEYWLISVQTRSVEPLKIIVIEDFGYCPDLNIEKAVVKLLSAKFGMVSTTRSELNFTVNITSDSPPMMFGFASLLRCPTLIGVDDCEKFLEIKVEDYCPKFVEKNQAWSFVFDKMKPPMECPVKKGIRTVIGGYPIFSKIKYFIDNANVHKISFDLYGGVSRQNYSRFGCLQATVRAAVVRRYIYG